MNEYQIKEFLSLIGFIVTFISCIGSAVFALSWFYTHKKIITAEKILISILFVMMVTGIVFTCRYRALSLNNSFNAEGTLRIENSVFYSGEYR